jgi:hypothetical protein
MSQLKIAIEGFYAAFADVPAPNRIDACPCCVEHKNIQILQKTPLRKITPEDLSSYASSAFLTAGGVDDYLYFLPRIMELSASDEGWWPDPEVTGRAIAETNPASWTTARRDALARLLSAILDVAIDAEDGWGIDSWLCAIARMKLDVRPFLSQITRSKAAVFDYFKRNADSLPKKGRLSNAFWRDYFDQPGHSAIVEWFYSEQVRAMLVDENGLTWLFPRE